MQDWAMDPEKDRIAREKEEGEKDENMDKDNPETLRQAREWDEYRDGKDILSVSLGVALLYPPQTVFVGGYTVFLLIVCPCVRDLLFS